MKKVERTIRLYRKVDVNESMEEIQKQRRAVKGSKEIQY